MCVCVCVSVCLQGFLKQQSPTQSKANPTRNPFMASNATSFFCEELLVGSCGEGLLRFWLGAGGGRYSLWIKEADHWRWRLGEYWKVASALAHWGPDMIPPKGPQSSRTIRWGFWGGWENRTWSPQSSGPSCEILWRIDTGSKSDGNRNRINYRLEKPSAFFGENCVQHAVLRDGTQQSQVWCDLCRFAPICVANGRAI